MSTQASMQPVWCALDAVLEVCLYLCSTGWGGVQLSLRPNQSEHHCAHLDMVYMWAVPLCQPLEWNCCIFWLYSAYPKSGWFSQIWKGKGVIYRCWCIAFHTFSCPAPTGCLTPFVGHFGGLGERPVPVPLCPQIARELAWDRTRGYATRHRRVIAWAMVRRLPGVVSVKDAEWSTRCS
jgi:hypothetical protein